MNRLKICHLNPYHKSLAYDLGISLDTLIVMDHKVKSPIKRKVYSIFLHCLDEFYK